LGTSSDLVIGATDNASQQGEAAAASCLPVAGSAGDGQARGTSAPATEQVTAPIAAALSPWDDLRLSCGWARPLCCFAVQMRHSPERRR
jgi:hypothetical protein